MITGKGRPGVSLATKKQHKVKAKEYDVKCLKNLGDEKNDKCENKCAHLSRVF